MLDSALGKIVAGLGMMACCGLSMALAVGLIAFSSAQVVSGLAVAVALGCVAFTMALGHRHHHGEVVVGLGGIHGAAPAAPLSAAIEHRTLRRV